LKKNTGSYNRALLAATRQKEIIEILVNTQSVHILYIKCGYVKKAGGYLNLKRPAVLSKNP